MSKATALEMATGVAPTQVNPSIVAGEPPTKTETNLSPGLAQTETLSSEVTEKASSGSLESDRFARIAQREAKLQEERALAKKELEEARAEKEKIRHINDQVRKFEELKKKDPVAAINELGFSNTDFINWMVEQNKELTPEEKAAKIAQETTAQQIEAFKKEQAEKEAKILQEKDMKAVTGFKQTLGKFITENAEKFEALAYQGEAGQEMVYNAVLAHIKDNPSADEDPYTIAKDIMEIYEEYLAEEFLEMAKLKKYQEKLKTLAAPQTETTKVEAAKPTRTRTLDTKTQTVKKIPSPSNAHTATVAGVANTTKKETPAEKRERLMNMLRGG